jgi:hypothetical protein
MSGQSSAPPGGGPSHGQMARAASTRAAWLWTWG